ncbi:MAG: Zn-ribbon domain-containing OB-fold protein [Burkholderiaceae bacterium]
MAQDRTLPAPPVYVDAAPFWAGAAEGRLMIRRCPSCGKAHWYPRPHCPLCGHGETDWEAASGRGTIYSVSVTRRVPVPYAVAYVTLEEGPTMLTNIVDCDLDGLKIGDAVSVTFKPAEDGQMVPMFRPA